MNPNNFPTYDELYPPEMYPFGSVQDLRQFRLVAYIPPVGIWGSTEAVSRLAGRVYDTMLDVLQQAELFHEEHLGVTREDQSLELQYNDDTYQFSVVVSEGQIAIERSGSSLARFHDWYGSLMPSAESIFTSIAAAIGDALETEFKVTRSLHLVRAQYQFVIIGYDFMAPEQTDALKNFEVINPLIGSSPGKDGHLVDPNELTKELGRIDWKVSRWSRAGEGSPRRREIYEVEAPGNRKHTSVWFTFTYIGETYVDPYEGTREPFDGTWFLTDFRAPYVEFLNHCALRGFLRDLLEPRQLTFSTTAGFLP